MPITAIVLTSVWTPIIVKITSDKKSISQQNNSEVLGPSIFDGNANNNSSNTITSNSLNGQNGNSQDNSSLTSSEN